MLIDTYNYLGYSKLNIYNWRFSINFYFYRLDRNCGYMWTLCLYFLILKWHCIIFLNYCIWFNPKTIYNLIQWYFFCYWKFNNNISFWNFIKWHYCHRYLWSNFNWSMYFSNFITLFVIKLNYLCCKYGVIPDNSFIYINNFFNNLW